MTAREPSGRAGLTRWLLDELPARLPPWLAEQRWFGGKSRRIGGVAVSDVFWLPPPAEEAALLVVDVVYEPDGGGATSPPERYALVVAEDARADAPGAAALPWREAATGREVAASASVVRALVAVLVNGTPVPGVRGGRLGVADVTARAVGLITGGGTSQVVPLGAEQSNTSVRLDRSHVFKLFRRLEAGVHPEVEIGRFLARAGGQLAPPLDGSILYVDPAGRESALAVLEGWLENVGDGWTHVTRALARGFDTSRGPDDMARELFDLGSTTADFHRVLASDATDPAFAPEPVTPEDRSRWCGRSHAQATRSLALVARLKEGWGADDAGVADALLMAGPRLAGRLTPLDPRLQMPFDKIRTHGDYHLGQTLKTADRFAIIDFEGEPTRALAERREKGCALRDVAGMLRSLDYASAYVDLRQTSGQGRALVAADLRRAFLDGYRSRLSTSEARFVPATAEGFDAWLAIFEVEKVFYEIEYEATHRPDWQRIPLQAAVRLLGDAA